MILTPLGLLLQDSLDAAFCGEVFCGPRKIADWGREIMGSLQEALRGQDRTQEILWSLARRVLKDLTMDHNGPEMLAQILENPGAFLRSLLLTYYGELPEETTAGWNPPPFH
jgi:hypothetical protein